MRRMIYRADSGMTGVARRGIALVGLRELCIVVALIAVMACGFDRVQRDMELGRPSDVDLLPTVHGLVIDDSAQELWALCRAAGVARYSLPTLEQVDFVPFDHRLDSAAMTSSAVFACATSEDTVEIHINGQKVADIPNVSAGPSKRVQPHGAVAVSHDGSVIVAATADGSLHRWRRREEQLQHDVQTPRVFFERLELHRDGRQLAILYDRSHVGIWNLERGAWEREWNLEHPFCSGLAWSADGNRLVTVGSDAQVCLWDAQRGELLWKRTGDMFDPAGAAFSPSGQWLVTGGFDKRVRLWDANSGTLVAEHAGHTRAVRVFAWSADSRRLYSSGHDGQVRAWDIPAASQPTDQ